MAAVQLESALTAFAGIFPADAPKPTLPRLTEGWHRRIGSAGGSRAVLLAGTAGTVIGTAIGEPDPVAPSRGHLCSLYVLPAYWQKGIGRQLHDAVVDHLRGCGFDLASLWVLERNESARARYERWGWRLSPTARRSIPASTRSATCALSRGDEGS